MAFSHLTAPVLARPFLELDLFPGDVARLAPDWDLVILVGVLPCPIPPAVVVLLVNSFALMADSCSDCLRALI